MTITATSDRLSLARSTAARVHSRPMAFRAAGWARALDIRRRAIGVPLTPVNDGHDGSTTDEVPPRSGRHRQGVDAIFQPGIDCLHRSPAGADCPHPVIRGDPGLQLTRTPAHRVHAGPGYPGHQLDASPA